MSAGPAISFVIPVRNDAVRLARCLDTIAACDAPGISVECLVADNGSTDASAEAARSRGARVLSLPNLGVSALRNRAAAEAQGDVLAFVDADHELGPGWIRAVVDVFQDAHVAAAGALCLPPQGTWVHRMYGALRGRTVGHGAATWLGSGNLAMRRATFTELRGFDESLQTCEDVDLCGRLRSAGWRLVADERFVNVHMGDPGTLRDLFRSERWRGRDNLRVSLRSVPTLADVPSIVIPIIDAAAMFTVVAGLLAAPFVGLTALVVAAAAVMTVLALAGVRTARMVLRSRLCQPLDLLRAFVVALVYDAGRASSLVWPARPPASSRTSSSAPGRMSEPIRILELRSVRGTGGGPEKTILLGARHADPARFAVTVCYIRDLRDTEFQMDRRARELGLDYADVAERHSFDYKIWPALRALVRDRRIQIVHAHDYKTNLLAWFLSRAERVIPLSTVHGWFGREAWRERLYYGADKRVLKRYPRVIAVSTALKAELLQAGAQPERITVVQNGIDHRLFTRVPGEREGIRHELGLAEHDVVIGAVGRLELQKRFDLLMEAVAGLRSKHPSLRLLIVGDGGLNDELLGIHRRLALGDACVFLGHRTDVPRLHHAFDLFVQSSEREGSPNVVLEAMALETPVVATDVGGTADMMTDGKDGLIVSPGSAAVLANAIERVLSDWPAAHARAAAARLRVETELSFDVRMDRVERIYSELFAGDATGKGR